MSQEAAVRVFHESYQRFGISIPRLHIVLGSGYAPVMSGFQPGKQWTVKGELSFREVPGLSSATAPGHPGNYLFFQHAPSGHTVTFQLGRLHGYEGIPAREAIRPVLFSCLAGTQRFILTNAAGALLKNQIVGSVMMIEDHVNLTGQNPLAGVNPTGLGGAPLGPRFQDLSDTYDVPMRDAIREALKKQKVETSQGIYLGLLGPSFETPAEVRLYASWGMHAVGMSTVWEAIALKHAGAKLAGLSLLSNLGCGLTDTPVDHEDVMKTAAIAAGGIIQGLFNYCDAEFSSHA